MSSFELALQAEIDALDAELRSDPRHQKLRELRRIQMLYNGGGPKPPVARERPTGIAPTFGPTGIAPTRRAASPERKAILEQAKDFIRGKTTPTTTTEIFECVSMFMDIPGKDPKNNLSAMLSNSPEFVSHGRIGWTLASAETPEAADDLVARSAPAASMSSPASPAGEPSSVRPVDPAPGGGT